MAYLWWVFPQFFCYINFTLTFSLIFVRRIFSKNQRIKSTQKTSATATSTAPGKFRLNPLKKYLRLAFPLLFCSVHFLLIFIFVVILRLMFSFSLFLYYGTSVAFIYRTLHNITIKYQEKQRRGVVQSLLFCLLNYIIIFSNIVFISNCCLLWLYKHSFRFNFLGWVHS